MLHKPFCHLLIILLLNANRIAFSINLNEFTEGKKTAEEPLDHSGPKAKSRPRKMHDEVITPRVLSRMYRNWLKSQPKEHSRKIPNFKSPEMMVLIASYLKQSQPFLYKKLAQADPKSRKLFDKNGLLKKVGGLFAGAMGKQIFDFILEYIDNQRERSRLIKAIEATQNKEKRIRKLYDYKKEEFKKAFTELKQNYDIFLNSSTEQTAALYNNLFSPKVSKKPSRHADESPKKQENPQADEDLHLDKLFDENAGRNEHQAFELENLAEVIERQETKKI